MPRLKPDPDLVNKVRSLTDKDLARFLRRSRDLAKRRKVAKSQGGAPRWTPEETALLGTRPDKEIARLLDRSVTGVALRRTRLKIPCLDPKARRWNDEERALLGTMSDKDLAAQIGLPVAKVQSYRERLHIPVFDRKLHAWTRADDKLLGKFRDEEIAERFGVTVSSIKHRRTRLGIYTPRKLKRPQRQQRPWTPEEIALLGKLNDRVIAKQIGRWVHYVRWKRQELGISTPFHKRWKPEEIKMLGKVPDAVIAQKTGRTIEAVSLRRLKLKVVPNAEPPRRWSQGEDKRLGKEPDKVIAERLKIPVLMVQSRRRYLGRPAWEAPRVKKKRPTPSRKKSVPKR